MKRPLSFVFLLGLLYSCGTDETVISTDPSAIQLVGFEANGKFGYKDTAGNIIIPAHYEFIYEFDTCLVTGVLDSNGWSIINKKDEIVFTPMLFDNGPDYFEEGLARFVENGKVGFFSSRGAKAVPAKYDFATPFKDGLASVCIGCAQVPLDEERMKIDGGKWGMIDKSGKEVLAFEYDKLLHFDTDSVSIQVGEKWYKMNIKTKEKFEIAGPKAGGY